MTTPKPSWKNRRRFMFIVSAFCGAVIAYALVWGDCDAVGETALTMAFTALIAIVGSYVFGATWDDKGR